MKFKRKPKRNLFLKIPQQTKEKNEQQHFIRTQFIYRLYR